MTTAPSLDLLVLGSGVAGLSAAVRAAALEGMRVGVLSKGELSQSATRWAQGGVAAALGGDLDSADLHLADTLSAGAGLCDPQAARVLVDEGPNRVQGLIALGAVFDRDAQGRLALSREGGHSVPRVVHAGGAATGAEIERTLVAAAKEKASTVMERWFAVDLLVEDGRCTGVEAIAPDGSHHRVLARHTLLATGGAGQLYAVTTNPEQATGDGIAMALRAAVAVADVEFVQFHPTALHHPQMPRPLLSEALRGHGALLRDATGARFVDELASRDVVALAMATRMLEQGVEHLWLDATPLEGFDERFPTIAAALAGAGLDPAVDWLPIAPAAHYLIGGVMTDLDGASAMPGLWAAGEVACTGVHGANRLGSNSLLEGMVFGGRVVEAIAAGREGPRPTGVINALLEDRVLRATAPLPPFWRRNRVDAGGFPRPERVEDDPGKLRSLVQESMTTGAGVRRDAGSLAGVAAVLARVTPAERPETAEGWELANLVLLGSSVAAAAETRRESRGAHQRTDHPERSAQFERRIVIA